MESTAVHYLGDLDAATHRVPAGLPYVMLNLLKFKENATYPSAYTGPKLPDHNSVTGRVAYIHYKDMFAERARELGVNVSVAFLGAAHTQLVAGSQEGGSWDVVIIAKFESWAAFQDRSAGSEVQEGN